MSNTEVLLQKLHESKLFQECPREIQAAIETLVSRLSGSWDDWDQWAEFDFCEDLLLNILKLPHSL